MTNDKKIKCLIFKSKNGEIEKITKAINEAKNVKQKAINARKLLNELEDLLACKYFKAEKAECNICRGIAKLRRRTADLIIRAKELT